MIVIWHSEGDRPVSSRGEVRLAEADSLERAAIWKRPARLNGSYGLIEIVDQPGFGFVVRMLDDGGLIFENDKAHPLAEAMAILEAGLTWWFKGGSA